MQVTTSTLPVTVASGRLDHADGGSISSSPDSREDQRTRGLTTVCTTQGRYSALREPTRTHPARAAGPTCQFTRFRMPTRPRCLITAALLPPTAPPSAPSRPSRAAGGGARSTSYYHARLGVKGRCCCPARRCRGCRRSRRGSSAGFCTSGSSAPPAAEGGAARVGPRGEGLGPGRWAVRGPGSLGGMAGAGCARRRSRGVRRHTRCGGLAGGRGGGGAGAARGGWWLASVRWMSLTSRSSRPASSSVCISSCDCCISKLALWLPLFSR